jgi:hypothetical protein
LNLCEDKRHQHGQGNSVSVRRGARANGLEPLRCG